MLIIKNLKVEVEGNKILKGLNLEIKKGEFHALMGPNGSGKSTLAYALMGHPSYKITEGTVFFEGKSLQDMSPDERAKLGIFLSFQHPESIPGVPVESFLRTAANSVLAEPYSVLEFRELLKEKGELLSVPDGFTKRYLNEGFSGGEKKKAEILQMSILKPKLAILDETDSGLDVDALRIVSNGVNQVREENPDMSVLIITHYQRILNYIKPDHIHVLIDGQIVESGGIELLNEIESKGYKRFIN